MSDRGPHALHLRGIVLPEGVARDVFVVGGRFQSQPPAEATTVLPHGYLLPGLVDAHAHLALASPAPPEATPEERVRASARAQLDAGVLLVREPGSPDYASAALGPANGCPRVITAGRFLAPANSYFPGLAREVAEDALPDAAAAEARRSGGWAKVIGDWVGPNGVVQLNYRAFALAEAAERVHALGARIAIHATVPATIEAAIESGFDSIEHGQGLADDHIAALVARGIALVPTLTILPALPAIIAELPLTPAARAAMLADVERHPAAVRRAAEAGVLVLAGTDAGLGPHGMVGEEIRRLRDAGLPQTMALAAGSWAARRYLGLPGIEEGAPADLIAYADDPREDPAVLARPILRLLAGRIVTPPRQ